VFSGRGSHVSRAISPAHCVSLGSAAPGGSVVYVRACGAVGGAVAVAGCVGAAVAGCVGAAVGASVGAAVGAKVGASVGARVGRGGSLLAAAVGVTAAGDSGDELGVVTRVVSDGATDLSAPDRAGSDEVAEHATATTPAARMAKDLSITLR